MNPQTTIALPFLTHNISAIGGVGSCSTILAAVKNGVKKYKPRLIMARVLYVSNNDIYGQSLKDIKYLLPTHFSHYYNMLPKRTSRPAGHLSVGNNCAHYKFEEPY